MSTEESTILREKYTLQFSDRQCKNFKTQSILILFYLDFELQSIFTAKWF